MPAYAPPPRRPPPPPWGARAKSAGLFFANSAEQFVTATNRNCSEGVTNRSGS